MPIASKKRKKEKGKRKRSRPQPFYLFFLTFDTLHWSDNIIVHFYISKNVVVSFFTQFSRRSTAQQKPKHCTLWVSGRRFRESTRHFFFCLLLVQKLAGPAIKKWVVVHLWYMDLMWNFFVFKDYFLWRPRNFWQPAAADGGWVGALTVQAAPALVLTTAEEIPSCCFYCSLDPAWSASTPSSSCNRRPRSRRCCCCCCCCPLRWWHGGSGGGEELKILSLSLSPMSIWELAGMPSKPYCFHSFTIILPSAKLSTLQ